MRLIEQSFLPDQCAELLPFYRREGYALVRGLIQGEAIEDVTREIDALYVLQLHRLARPVTAYSGAGSVLRNMRELFAADTSVYLATTRHAAKLASLQRLAVSDPVMGLVRAFGMTAPTLPTSPVLHVMSDALKIPAGYHGIAPHQDWPSIQGGLDTVTLWLPLFDVNQYQFPLDLIPGSHLRGLWKGRVSDTAMEVDPSQYGEADFVRVPARRGDALVFTGFTVHRTAVEGCRGLRLASSTRYENAAEPTFAARSYPCAYRRSVVREYMVENFPAAADVQRALGMDTTQESAS